jgi:hypothetical protein
MKRGFLSALAVAACSRGSVQRDAYAVGTYIGAGSALISTALCTYDAPPTVAELFTDAQGRKFMAKLIGEGTITETCPRTKTVYDVVKATGGRIDGPQSCSVGGTETCGPFQFVAMAGARELRGVHQGGESPTWSLGNDCRGVAVFGPVLGAQDTGGRSIIRSLVGRHAGSCTVTARILGVAATKTVEIR